MLKWDWRIVMESKLSVKDVVEAINMLSSDERAELVSVLPAILRLTPDDYGWLQVAERSFAFWDNDDDAIYDNL